MEIHVKGTSRPLPIVFDLDGTLIDSAPDIHNCVNCVLDRNGVPMLTLSEIRSFIGGGVEVLWQKIMTARTLPEPQITGYINAFMTNYEGATDLTSVYPGVGEALQHLFDRGHPLGLCTNKPLSVTKIVLDRFDIAPFFSSVIAGDCFAQRKPHPRPLRAAFEKLGCDTADIRGFYVGDSDIDAACAAALPVPFLFFTEGYSRTGIGNLPHLATFNDFSIFPALVDTYAAA